MKTPDSTGWATQSAIRAVGDSLALYGRGKRSYWNWDESQVVRRKRQSPPAKPKLVAPSLDDLFSALDEGDE